MIKETIEMHQEKGRRNKKMTETLDSIEKAMESANMGVSEVLPEEKDNINPDHYKNSTSLECIEAMELVFGKQAVIDFCKCNAWKYIWRWKHKNGVEDLEKAKWYIIKASELDPTNYSVMLERMELYVKVNIREVINNGNGD